MEEGPEARRRLAAGWLFVLPALPGPSFAGTCSDAVGAAFGAVLPGPGVMTDGGVTTFRFAWGNRGPVGGVVGGRDGEFAGLFAIPQPHTGWGEGIVTFWPVLICRPPTTQPVTGSAAG